MTCFLVGGNVQLLGSSYSANLAGIKIWCMPVLFYAAHMLQLLICATGFRKSETSKAFYLFYFSHQASSIEMRWSGVYKISGAK